jgi:hypothetical protein
MKFYYATFLILIIILLFSSCASQKPINTYSKKIIFKSKKLKFYDVSFVSIYKNYLKLEVFNSANLILTLKIYKNEICKDSFRCVSAKEFNKQYFGANSNYPDSFLYDLFLQKNANFRDKKNKVLIKIF